MLRSLGGVLYLLKWIGLETSRFTCLRGYKRCNTCNIKLQVQVSGDFTSLKFHFTHKRDYLMFFGRSRKTFRSGTDSVINGFQLLQFVACTVETNSHFWAILVPCEGRFGVQWRLPDQKEFCFKMFWLPFRRMILRHRKFRVKEYWMINATIKICNSNLHCSCEVNIKVAEHSFQVPMPNSSLLLNYALAPVFCKSQVQKFYSRILSGVWAVAMATGWLKIRLEKGFWLI